MEVRRGQLQRISSPNREQNFPATGNPLELSASRTSSYMSVEATRWACGRAVRAHHAPVLGHACVLRSAEAGQSLL